MAVRAKLKFRGDMPWDLEHKLISKYGFSVASRNKKEWVILEKYKVIWKPEVLVNGELPEDIQNMLIKRCNTIVNQFDNPEPNEFIIRTRLQNIARTLPPLQRKFVHDWILNNLGEE